MKRDLIAIRIEERRAEADRRLPALAVEFDAFSFELLHGSGDISHAKGRALFHEYFQKWNSFSRIGVAYSPSDGIDMIYIDADASTGIANFDFDHLTPHERHDLLEQGPALPYAVRPGAKALVIGPGGGWDVARALASGSHDVTGVEINPIIASTIMREKHPEWSNYLYNRPDVHIYVEDGRSFVRQSREKYQVLEATLVDTWAATAAKLSVEAVVLPMMWRSNIKSRISSRCSTLRKWSWRRNG